MYKTFQHFFLVIFENKTFDSILADSFMAELAKKGVLLTNFYGVTHPSQPNYIASVGASTLCVNHDNCLDLNNPLEGKNLIDLIEDNGLSWKAYMEDLPTDKLACNSDDGSYVRRHNPFTSFETIVSNPNRMAKIVDADELEQDLNDPDNFPAYSWYSPNVFNDGHTARNPTGDPQKDKEQEITQLSAWLKEFLDKNERRFPEGTMIVITFDEDDYSGTNQVYTLLLGETGVAKAGTEIHDRFDHYSLIRTIEENFGLGDLNRFDKIALPLSFLWGELVPPVKPLSWAKEVATGANANGDLVSAVLHDIIYTVYQSSEGGLMYMTSETDGSWSAPCLIRSKSVQNPALATYMDELHLVFQEEDHTISWLVLKPGAKEWEKMAQSPGKSASSMALHSYKDLLILVNATVEKSEIQWQFYDGTTWTNKGIILGMPPILPPTPLAEGGGLGLVQHGDILLLVFNGFEWSIRKTLDWIFFESCGTEMSWGVWQMQVDAKPPSWTVTVPYVSLTSLQDKVYLVHSNPITNEIMSHDFLSGSWGSGIPVTFPAGSNIKTAGAFSLVERAGRAHLVYHDTEKAQVVDLQSTDITSNT